MRGRTRLVVSLVLGLVAASAVGGCTTPRKAAVRPVAVDSVAAIARYLYAGRLTRPVQLDGGALRLEPPNGTAAMTEDRAIATFRAAVAPGGFTMVGGTPDVLLVRATLTIPVATENLVVVAQHAPVFNRRLAWVIVYDNGAHSCPAARATTAQPGIPTHEPLNVVIISADHGLPEAVRYAGRGHMCSSPVREPTARPWGYYLSLPWRITATTRSGYQIDLAGALPPCASIAGHWGPGWPDTTIAVSAWVSMVRSPCTATGPSGAFLAHRTRDGSPPRHAPTGLRPSLYTATNPYTFTYYDGRTRVIRDSP